MIHEFDLYIYVRCFMVSQANVYSNARLDVKIRIDQAGCLVDVLFLHRFNLSILTRNCEGFNWQTLSFDQPCSTLRSQKSTVPPGKGGYQWDLHDRFEPSSSLSTRTPYNFPSWVDRWFGIHPQALPMSDLGSTRQVIG